MRTRIAMLLRQGESLRMIQEAVQMISEMDDTNCDVVVVAQGVGFAVAGVDCSQIGLSPVLCLEVFPCGSANNHPLGRGNDMQSSRPRPLHHHSLQHLQYPKSSKVTFLAKEHARAISIPRASRTLLRLHKAFVCLLALKPLEDIVDFRNTKITPALARLRNYVGLQARRTRMAFNKLQLVGRRARYVSTDDGEAWNKMVRSRMDGWQHM